MALKYVVKKTTFGFDKEKAEKYVARPFNVVTVDFKNAMRSGNKSRVRSTRYCKIST